MNAASEDTRDTDSDDTMAMAQVKMMEKYMSQGYRLAKRDDKSNLCTFECPDEIKCRGRRPVQDKYRGTATLQF